MPIKIVVRERSTSGFDAMVKDLLEMIKKHRLEKDATARSAQKDEPAASQAASPLPDPGKSQEETNRTP